MSSQDLFLQQFGQGGRETPAPVQQQFQALPVPTGVPFVAPRNVVPSNIGDMARYSKLNQLAKALEVGGVGSGMASMAMHLAQKKQEMAQNEAYSRGLVDATNRAAQARDVYADISKNGMAPANKNPFYVMGYQALLSQELGTQYRNELVQSRQQNPGADPLELQDQLKQKYMGLFQGVRPDMVAKYFIEPSMAADKDDHNAFQKFQGDQFTNQMDNSPASAVGNLFQSEMPHVQDGSSNMAMLGEKAVKTIETSLQTSYATGWDYHKQVDKIFEVVEANAAMLTDKDGQPASLKDKQALLDTLKNVKLPTGNSLLAEADYIKKFKEAKERLVNQAHKEDKEAGEALDGVVKLNTQKYKIMMGDDARDGKLKPYQDYLKIVPKGEAIDPTALSQAYSAINTNSQSTEEQAETESERDLAIDVNVNQLTPDQVETKYGDRVGRGVNAGKFAVALSSAASNQRHQQEQLRQSPVPVGEMNVYLNQIHARVSGPHSAGRWSGYGKDQAVNGISKDLKTIYEQEFRRRYLAQQAQNPQGAQNPQTRMDWMQNIWNQLQGPLMQDYQHIQNQDYGNYSDFISRNRFGTRVYSSPASSPAKPKAPQTPSGYAAQFPYAVNQQSFAKENQLFKQHKGMAYQWMVNAAGDKADYHWRRYMQLNPDQPVMGIVEYLQSLGKPTFLGQRKPQPQTNNRR